MKKRILSIGLFITLILTMLFQFNTLDIKVYADNTFNTGDWADEWLEEGRNLYFRDDTSGVSVTTRLYEILYVVATQCTSSSLAIMSEGSNSYMKTYVEVEYDAETTGGSSEPSYDCLKASSLATVINTKLVSQTQNGTLIVTDLYNNKSYKISVNSTNYVKIKYVLCGFYAKLQETYSKCLLSQSVLIMSSSLEGHNILSGIMTKQDDNSYEFNDNVKSKLITTPTFLLHPIFGRLEGEEVISFLEDCETLKYSDFAVMEYNNSNKKMVLQRKEEPYYEYKVISGKAGYKLDDEYMSMLNDKATYLKGYNEIKEETGGLELDNLPCRFTYVSRSAASNTATTPINIRPKYLMSYLYTLAVPDNYTKSGFNASIYTMENASTFPKYLCIDGVAINVKTNKVYQFIEGVGYTEIGDFAKFNIDRNYIYLHNSLRTDIKYSDVENLSDELAKQHKQGVAVCTKLYEAVWDTTVTSTNTIANLTKGVLTEANVDGGLWLTGREILLDANYLTKVPFDNTSIPTIRLQAGNSVNTSCAKFFAFNRTDTTNACDKNSHYYTKGEHFRFQAVFLNVEGQGGDSGVQGVCLIRNNYYATDADIVKWLSSEQAKGIAYVDAERLLNLLTNSSTATDNRLTYEEFKKLEVVKEKLAHLNDNAIFSVTRIILIIAGYLFIFYGAILALAFWMDLMDVFTGTSILQIISLNKLRACSVDEYEYCKQNTKYKYITWKQMLIRMFACFFIGIIFINFQWVFGGIIYIYTTIQELTGIA